MRIEVIFPRTSKGLLLDFAEASDADIKLTLDGGRIRIHSPLRIDGLPHGLWADPQRELKAKGKEFVAEADESTTGPESFIVVDPDGNLVLVDQHV